VGNCRSSTRTAEPRTTSRNARSLKSPDTAFSTVSNPLSLRSATSAPRSAGCSQAAELMSVRVTRDRAGWVVMRATLARNPKAVRRVGEA
jgi:hypothetical protein